MNSIKPDCEDETKWENFKSRVCKVIGSLKKRIAKLEERDGSEIIDVQTMEIQQGSVSVTNRSLRLFRKNGKAEDRQQYTTGNSTGDLIRLGTQALDQELVYWDESQKIWRSRPENRTGSFVGVFDTFLLLETVTAENGSTAVVAKDPAENGWYAYDGTIWKWIAPIEHDMTDYQLVSNLSQNLTGDPNKYPSESVFVQMPDAVVTGIKMNRIDNDLLRFDIDADSPLGGHSDTEAIPIPNAGKDGQGVYNNGLMSSADKEKLDNFNQSGVSVLKADAEWTGTTNLDNNASITTIPDVSPFEGMVVRLQPSTSVEFIDTRTININGSGQKPLVSNIISDSRRETGPFFFRLINNRWIRQLTVEQMLTTGGPIIAGGEQTISGLFGKPSDYPDDRVHYAKVEFKNSPSSPFGMTGDNNTYLCHVMTRKYLTVAYQEIEEINSRFGKRVRYGSTSSDTWEAWGNEDKTPDADVAAVILQPATTASKTFYIKKINSTAVRGSVIKIQFIMGHTANALSISPNISIGWTGSKTVYYKGSTAIPPIEAGGIRYLLWDGIQLHLIDDAEITTKEGKIIVRPSFTSSLYDAEGFTATASGTAAKVVTVSPEVADPMLTGMRIRVLFPNGTNANQNYTLNVNGRGAKTVYALNGTTTTKPAIPAGERRVFEYNGTSFRLMNGLPLWTDAQGKVRLLTGEPDIVVETVISGTQWYRLYRSGWIEQGGRLTKTSNAAETITFLKTMLNTNYSLSITVEDSRSTDASTVSPKITNITVNGMLVRIASAWSNGANFWASGVIIWEVKGMSA